MKMLKITKVKEIPKEIEEIVKRVKAKEIYISEGMFGTEAKDYLVIIKEERFKDEIRCQAYVYNGEAPHLSEFGYIGLNKAKSERIW